jgi:PilZ domain
MSHHKPGLSQTHGSEQRRWLRLPLAIPVFVRGLDGHGKGFLEFSTLLNESAGGALLAIRRSLRPSSRISLEVPSAPISVRAGLPHAIKMLRARVIRITSVNGWNLCGLQFTRAIVRSTTEARI